MSVFDPAYCRITANIFTLFQSTGTPIHEMTFRGKQTARVHKILQKKKRGKRQNN
jgi:hypothetical protein